MSRAATTIGRALALLGLLGLLSACGAEFLPRHRKPEALAPGWTRLVIDVQPFPIVGYLPPASPVRQGLLTVYIEGDGLAFLGRRMVSPDPTPDDPLALRLAVLHPGGGAAYLARPCQFAMGRACDPYFWTLGRFAPEVVAAEDAALDVLKRRTGATRLVLVGYSGGGNIAALLAERRADVVGLVTVAGNLDHRAWTAMDRLQPLEGSLSALDAVETIAALPQAHFTGADDDVVSPDIVRSFVRHLPAARAGSLRVIPGYDHVCCWAESWPATLATAGELAGLSGWMVR